MYIFQGIVNKWYDRMWLDSTCRCPIRFKKLHFAPKVNNEIFFLNDIFITWHSLIFLFCYYPPKRKMWPFISKRLNPLYPRILCSKFGRNWPSGSWVKNFFKSSMYTLYVPIISPWNNAWPLNWTNLNSLYPR